MAFLHSPCIPRSIPRPPGRLPPKSPGRFALPRSVALVTASAALNRLKPRGRSARRKRACRVCQRSHRSGVSVRLDPPCARGAITLELHSDEGDGVHPLRRAVIDPAKIEPGEIEHLYWEPVETSKGRFFFLHARPSRDGGRRSVFAVPPLLEVKLIHSPPQAYVPLPEALLFSPVSQCNLNCTHAFAATARSCESPRRHLGPVQE